MKRQYLNRWVAHILCKAITIYLTLYYPPKKKKDLSVYGRNDICGI